VTHFKASGAVITRTFEFQEFTLQHVPREEFTLAAFGLGDLAAPSPKTGSSVVVWLVLLAALALGASLFFRRLARRAVVSAN
jgi:LPXTG-motif cell wall-anchored protein